MFRIPLHFPLSQRPRRGWERTPHHSVKGLVAFFSFMPRPWPGGSRRISAGRRVCDFAETHYKYAQEVLSRPLSTLLGPRHALCAKPVP